MHYHFGYPFNPERSTLLPGVPTDLTVVKQDDTNVLASWSAPVGGDVPADSYELDYEDGILTVRIGTETTVLAPPNVAVDYKVRSVSVDGNRSAWTDVVTYTNVVDADIVYVTNLGAGTKDGSDMANAMGIAEHNAATIIAGSTVILSGDISNSLTVSHSGAVGFPITYDGDDGVNPPAHFQLTQVYDTKAIVCPDYIPALEYLIFQNIEISNASSGMMFYPETAQSLYFYNNNIHDMLTRGIWLASSLDLIPDSIDDIVIGGSQANGNTLYNIGEDTAGGDVIISDATNLVISYNTMSADGVSAKGVDGIVLFQCDGFLIEHNDLSNHINTGAGGEDGIDLKDNNKNGVIRYNTCNNNGQTGITSQMGTHDVEIYGNYFEGNNWAGMAVYMGAGGPWNAGFNIDVHHNIFYENLGNGMQNTCSGSDSIDCNNNVFVRNGIDPYNATDTNIQYFAGTNCSIQNNIFYEGRTNLTGNDKYQINVAGDYDQATGTLLNNLYYDSTQTSKSRWGVSPSVVDSTVAEPTLEEGDPLFVDDTSDFMVYNTSQAIDNGADLGYATDYADNTNVPPINIGGYDVDAGDAPSNPELNPNPDFTDNVDGWIDYSQTVLTWSALGYLVADSTTSDTYVVCDSMGGLTNGTRYAVSFRAESLKQQTSIRVYDGTGYLNVINTPDMESGMADYSFEFDCLADTGNFILRFYGTEDVQTVTMDSCSITVAI